MSAQQTTWKITGMHCPHCERAVVRAVASLPGIASPRADYRRATLTALWDRDSLPEEQLRIAPVEKTHTCPLARVMRTECRKRHIRGLKVAFSTEPPVPIDETEDISCRTHCVCPPGTARKCTIRRDIPGSTAFVPSSMGLLIASEVVRDLTRNSE